MAVGCHRPNRTHSPLVEQGMKKRHLIAAGIVVAVVAMVVLLWVGEGPLWRLVLTKRITIQEFNGIVGKEYYTVKGHALREVAN